MTSMILAMAMLASAQVSLGPPTYGGAAAPGQPVWSGGHAAATFSQPGGGYAGVRYRLYVGDPADERPLSRVGISVSGTVTLGQPVAMRATQVSSSLCVCSCTLEADWSRGRYTYQFADGSGGVVAVAPQAGDVLRIDVNATPVTLGNGFPVCKGVMYINGTPVATSTRLTEFDHVIGVGVRLYGLQATGTPGVFSNLSVN